MPAGGAGGKENVTPAHAGQEGDASGTFAMLACMHAISAAAHSGSASGCGVQAAVARPPPQ